jgi:flagellar assembly protein FliH
MGPTAKFLFDTDFRRPAPAPRNVAAEEAEARGYGRGLADGRRQAEVEAQTRLAIALDAIAARADALLAEADRHRAETEALAVEFALAMARKLAGDALAREPLAAIADAAAQSFQHLRGVPHLVLRVNDALVEPVDALMRRMARERGFEGRLVILGEPDLAPGDVRLEWADGGIVRDQARIERAVGDALRR